VVAISLHRLNRQSSSSESSVNVVVVITAVVDCDELLRRCLDGDVVVVANAS